LNDPGVPVRIVRLWLRFDHWLGHRPLNRLQPGQNRGRLRLAVRPLRHRQKEARQLAVKFGDGRASDLHLDHMSYSPVPQFPTFQAKMRTRLSLLQSAELSRYTWLHILISSPPAAYPIVTTPSEIYTSNFSTNRGTWQK